MTSQASIDLTVLVDPSELYRHAFLLTGTRASQTSDNETVVVPLTELSQKFGLEVVCYGIRFNTDGKEVVQGIVAKTFKPADVVAQSESNFDDYVEKTKLRVVERKDDGSFIETTETVPAIPVPYFSASAAETLVERLRSGVLQMEAKPPEKVRYL
jgi:hypothetical protein